MGFWWSCYITCKVSSIWFEFKNLKRTHGYFPSNLEWNRFIIRYDLDPIIYRKYLGHLYKSLLYKDLLSILNSHKNDAWIGALIIISSFWQIYTILHLIAFYSHIHSFSTDKLKCRNAYNMVYVNKYFS